MSQSLRHEIIPRGWIPPSPYILKTFFDRAQPGGKMVTLTKPKSNVCIVVTFAQGATLDEKWESWFTSAEKEKDGDLPFPPD